MKTIDIHTHHLNPEKIQIYICKLNETPKPIPKYYAYGIHPWDLEKFKFKDLENTYSNLPFKILGEIGIDRVIKTDLQNQIDIFKRQLQFAKNNHIPIIVLHCVKAYNDIFQILKESQYKGRILLHDYNSTKEMAKQYLTHFDCYFSFGEKLFNSSTNAYKSLPSVPIERIFCETDDQQNHSIEAIYDQCSKVLSIPLEELEIQLEKNFKLFIENY